MRKIKLLHIEDNEGDILLTSEALETFPKIHQLTPLKNGQDGINYLTKNASDKDGILPDIILLDINLPLKDGFEVLDLIKTSKLLKHIPVIVFTTSSFQKDVSKAYQKHANCFISKPSEIEDFFKIVTLIENFWANTITLA